MINLADDQMWTEFQPLWGALRVAGSGLLVAGGYGLFLKQHWLLTNPTVPTIVPLERWGDQTPRVTKDLDIVVGLDLIASETAQGQMIEALHQRGFMVVDKNQRWQFEKALSTGKQILVDLHADLPTHPNPHLALDKLRVKHKPSLGEAGIHGRQNAEAAGCEHHPFQFDVGGVGIGVPNPVTWSVMKLVAMRDQWNRAEDKAREQRQREHHREQAIKHAQDVCRVVAMTTRDEAQVVSGVVAAIREAPHFMDAVKIRGEFFDNQDGWSNQVVRRAGRADDLDLVRRTLATWFR